MKKVNNFREIGIHQDNIKKKPLRYYKNEKYISSDSKKKKY